MNGPTNRVLIIGGGIGGLAAAIALRRAGIDVAVFERKPEIAEVGAGLQLQSTALASLRWMGIADAVIDAGMVIEGGQTLSWRGERFFSPPLDKASREGGPAQMSVTRPALLRILRATLDDAVITTGAQCVGFRQDETGVTALFADGREEQGQALIGADGIHSAVRAQIHGNVKPRYAGYTCWRGLATFTHPDLPPDMLWAAQGRGARFGIVHVDPDCLYWFALSNAPEGAPDAPIGRKAEVLQRFRGWTDPIEALIEATDSTSILRTDIYDRDPIQRWGEGRVTLLGDAAHPTTPNMAQGACMAIEDAAELGQLLTSTSGLTSHADLPALLRAYEGKRAGPTARIVKMSRRIGSIGQMENPVGVAMRNNVSRLLRHEIFLRVLHRVVVRTAQRR